MVSLTNHWTAPPNEKEDPTQGSQGCTSCSLCCIPPSTILTPASLYTRMSTVHCVICSHVRPSQYRYGGALGHYNEFFTHAPGRGPRGARQGGFQGGKEAGRCGGVALPPPQYRNANINVVLGKQKLRRPRRFSKSSQGDGVRWLGLKTPINFCHNPKECTLLLNPGGKRRPILSDNPDCHFLSSILSDLPKINFGFYNTVLF